VQAIKFVLYGCHLSVEFTREVSMKVHPWNLIKHFAVTLSINTGCSKSHCALDDYSTAPGAQTIFDHPVY